MVPYDFGDNSEFKLENYKSDVRSEQEEAIKDFRSLMLKEYSKFENEIGKLQLK